MELFVEKIQRVLNDAQRQFHQLVGADCEIQHSYLFSDGKFIGLRLVGGTYRIEWRFETDQMTLIEESASPAPQPTPVPDDTAEERRAA